MRGNFSKILFYLFFSASMNARSRKETRRVFAPMKYLIKISWLCMFASFAMSLHAAPDGYSVNSDSGSNDADSLYRIDLATGANTRLGRVQSLGQTRIDVEGLAFSPDGTLYGIDDDSLKLFPINTDNGIVLNQQEVSLTGFPSGGGNDFGLTFGCDGNLYASSVSTDSLYRVALNGTTTQVGSLGSLAANISALAAWGDPVQLYGLGNGLLSDGVTVDSRKLYSINTTTGVANVIGDIGAAAGAYNEAGLAFDSDGVLWAITDRRAVQSGFPSQVLRIDTATGVATSVSNTTEQGFESLAITVPRGCTTGNGQTAQFEVQKRFVDHNDVTPVTLNISCNTGLPLQQSVNVVPNDGLFGGYEVNFVVESFDDGELSCTITETAVAGYSPTYTCLGESTCGAAQSAESCVFSGVTIGSENLCQVQNYPNPVQFTVNKEWLFDSVEVDIAPHSVIELECIDVFGGDGVADGSRMVWTWQVDGNSSFTANVEPDFAGGTVCRATEHATPSGIEASNGCENGTPVPIGSGPLSCSIINTIFLEGIPTLNEYGLLLFALLMLGTGLVVLRRI